MVKFEAVELFLQAPDYLVVCIHLGIVATRIFDDLVNDEPRVASDIEPLAPKLDRDVDTVEKGLIFRHVV